jgi:acyl-coenzyme A thioesterase 13
MSLTDTLGSLAVATKGQYMTGVSVDISTSFIKPAGKVHDVFTAEAVVDGIGMCPRSCLSSPERARYKPCLPR